MRSSALLVLIALLAVGGAAYWFMFDEPPVAAPPQDPGVIEQPVAPADPVKDRSGKSDESGPVRKPAEINRQQITTDPNVRANADSPQGVKGRLLSPNGAPVADADVYLIRGVGVDSFQLLLRYQKGERFPPIAKGVSAADGTFRVGLPTYDRDKTFEVRVLHADYCDHALERITIQPQDWYDAKEITLKRGVTVFGSVLSETGAAIPDAIVTARPQFQSSLLSVPGREMGIEAKTDQAGYYEIRNIDPLNLMSISAHARNHTRVEKNELNLQGDRVQIDFQLGAGFEIGGGVVDEEGKPVRGAKITAIAQSQKAPQSEETYTGKDGSFFVVGLREGYFTLIVEADGFGRAEEKPIKAGDQEVSIVLEKLGRVEVTVLGANGSPVPSYTCNIKAVISGDDNFGKPLHSKQVRSASSGTTTVAGLIPMRYVAEILTDQYAKNFSPVFEIVAGQGEPARVQVQLNMGGSLKGVVRDTSGKPIGGVEIATQPKDMVENKLIEAFGGMPYTITRGHTKSRKDGTFEFNRLLPGEYQLKFVHPEYCKTVTKGNIAVLNQVTELPPVAMERGAMVSGIAKIEGKPTGQIKVTVSNKPAQDQMSTFSTEAITDNEGRFLLPMRLPPGEYEARAAQMGLGPFQIILQFQKIKPFTIGSGVEHFQLQMDVPPIPK